MTTKTLAAHGTLSRYKLHGCRCDSCHSNYRAYENRRYRLRGYGKWQPLVDVTPVREHLARLIADGYTGRSIWTAANADSGALQRALYSPSKHIRSDVAERFLAVTPDQLKQSGARPVDGAGTRRRIQALVTIGWPLNHIARHIGMHPRPLSDLACAARVSRATARRIDASYRRLVGLDPATHGVPQAHVNNARKLAATRGWHGPLAWDDIDDPAALPEVDNGHSIQSTKRDAELADEVRHLAEGGVSTWEIATRVGRTERYIAQQLNGSRAPGWRNRTDLLEAAA